MVWECGMYKEGVGKFSKFVRYEVGDGSRCGFDMIYGVGSSLWSSLFQNYSLLLDVRMCGWG
jgi:hypothetical protein